MKITIEKYNLDWASQFLKLKDSISNILSIFSAQIEHIGSTSIPNLSAKPIIDIAIGMDTIDQLDEVVPIMMDFGFVYVSAYNSIMPERRFFVNLKNRGNFYSEYNDIQQIPHEEFHVNKIANIHAWVFNSPDWTRHIAFREYLKSNYEVRAAYQQLKEKLSNQNWANGNEYNDAKNEFIKREESKAIEWYNKNRLTFLLADM